MNNLTETIEDRKNRFVDKLSNEYSFNRISLEEYERLVHYSQSIETEKELQIFEKLVKEHTKEEDNFTSTVNNESYDNDKKFNNNPKDYFSVLSSRKKTGVITSGNYVNILADHKIIINEDDLINSETVLNCMVLLGSIVIHVPENVNVINKAMPILSDISIDDRIRDRGGRKSVIITGNVILGDIKVKVKKK